MRAVALVLALLVPAAAGAEAAPERPRDWGNLRVGASGDLLGGREELCLEVAPLAWLSFEGCGTGSGLLHRDPAPELGHFRAKLRVASRRSRTAWLGWLEPQLAVGFAELQVGEDTPGFHFGGTDPTRTETSGAEVGVALRSLVPLTPRWELVTTVGAYLAWLPHAPELARPMRALQPSFALSVGVGF